MGNLKVLLLGPDSRVRAILDARGCSVTRTEAKIETTGGFDLAISYGYRHILRGKALAGCPVINLHISLLPYCRGAHPNFWSLISGAPAGVTIHLMDSGIDTGPIIFQSIVKFHVGDDTFRKTYERLKVEIERLFEAHADEIIAGHYTPYQQRPGGTFHRASDLPPGVHWDLRIADYLRCLDDKYKVNCLG